MIDTQVQSQTLYFYRVRAVDSFGNTSLPSAARNATTAGAGGPAGLGFVDDADTRSYADLQAPWQIAAGVASDGQFAYRTSAAGVRYPKNTCASIELPALTIPDGATLHYDARYQLENQWDGVVVEISTDDGAAWTDLPPDGGYPGSFAQTKNPPINACGFPASRGPLAATPQYFRPSRVRSRPLPASVCVSAGGCRAIPVSNSMASSSTPSASHRRARICRQI